MFKIAVKNERFFKLFLAIPLLNKGIVFRIDKLDRIKNQQTYEIAFSRITTSNNTLKTTRSGRFKELDVWFSKFVKGGYQIHDVAVSNGITTWELFTLLSSQEKKINVYYSDKFGSCTVIKKKLQTLVYDADGKLMQASLGCIYADNKVSRWFFLSKFIFRFFPDHIKKLTGGKESKISLFHKILIENSEVFKEICYDIFTTQTEIKFDAVRAMNILNRAYFTDSELKVAIKNIISSVKDEGLILIGRTNNYINHGGIYRKRSGKLLLIENFNNGSEVHSIIEELNNVQ